MPENEFPYGHEFNPVGGEFNENYTSNVQGQRGSFKQEDLQNNSVQDVEQAATAPAGEATADALSGSAGSSTVTSAPTTSTATAATGSTTTTTIATTTGVVATGGVVIGAIIIAAAAANVFSRGFSMSVEPMSRSINYDLTVEFQTDNELYVSLIDEQKEEVALNVHALTVNDAYVEDGKLFYDVSGSFYGLETETNYTFEAYAFDSSGTRFSVYTSETSFVVPYTPITGAYGFYYTENPLEQTIEFSFDVTIEENTTIYAHLLDESGEEVALEEIPVRVGNETISEDPFTVTVSGSFSEINPDVDYIFEAYGYASDGSVFTVYRHDEPLRLGSIGVQFVDGFEYSYDVFKREALIFCSLGISKDETVYIRAVDENGDNYGEVSNLVKLEDASLDGDIYYYSLETTIYGLEPGIPYYFEVFVYDTENNEVVLYRTEEASSMASTNIISISSPSYSGNGYTRTLDYIFGVGVTASDVVYVSAIDIDTGEYARENEHAITFDDNSEDTEQYFTIRGTLEGIVPGDDYSFVISANDSEKETFTCYVEDGVTIPTIPINDVDNFVTEYDEIEQSIAYEFDVDTSEGHSVYVQLENSQRQQLSINEHYATPNNDGASNYTHLSGEFLDLDLDTPYYFSIYAFDEDNNQIELFASEEPVEIPTPTFGITDLTITPDPARKAIRVNASLYYDDDNVGKTAVIELLDSNDEPVSGEARLMAVSGQEAIDNEHVRSDGVLTYYNDGYTFRELTSGETYTAVISYLDYEGSQAAPTKVTLKQKEILLETSDQYLPFISLISYQADNMEQVVSIYYDYCPNGITYDHFDVLVENINGPDTLSDEYQDVGNGPSDNGNAVVVSMEGSSGYSYSIKLFGVDSLGNRTLLIQHAIYY